MIESFLTVGRQIITLYLLMAVGYVLGKLKLIDDHGAASMSTLVMYIVSPCMLLVDRKSTRLNSSHASKSRMPSSA